MIPPIRYSSEERSRRLLTIRMMSAATTAVGRSIGHQTQMTAWRRSAGVMASVMWSPNAASRDCTWEVLSSPIRCPSPMSTHIYRGPPVVSVQPYPDSPGGACWSGSQSVNQSVPSNSSPPETSTPEFSGGVPQYRMTTEAAAPLRSPTIRGLCKRLLLKNANHSVGKDV